MFFMFKLIDLRHIVKIVLWSNANLIVLLILQKKNNVGTRSINCRLKEAGLLYDWKYHPNFIFIRKL